MQCDNCGYIFFQPSRKCACCSAPYAPTQTSFDIGQENLFTIFEMAPGEGGIQTSIGTAGAGAGMADYDFTDDFDMGGAEYGVDENVLDLSDAEAEGFGPATSSIPVGADDLDMDSLSTGEKGSLEDDGGLDDFELDLSESTAYQVSNEAASVEADAVPDVSPESEAEVSLDLSPEDADTVEVDTASGFDSEVEGLGFGFDETPAGEKSEESEEATVEATEEITLDAEPESEAEISLEPELELSTDEPADKEISLDVPDEEEEGISLELPDEPESDTGDEEIVLSDDAGDEEIVLSDDAGDEEIVLSDDAGDEETALSDDAEGIDFDIDSVDNVDLDAPEEVVSVVEEEPEAVDTGDESAMELDGLEMEMEAPEEPEEDAENPKE